MKGEANEYRLGTIFLRNFYTSLDYDRDLIAIGVNRETAKKDRAFILGHLSDPFEELGPGGPSVFTYIIVVMLAMMCAGLTTFVISVVIQRRKKAALLKMEEERLLEQGEEDEEELTDEDLMVKDDDEETSPVDKRE